MKNKLTLILVVLTITLSSVFAQQSPKANTKQTSPKVAKEAAKTLRDPKASKREKSVAGSALSQSKGRKK